MKTLGAIKGVTLRDHERSEPSDLNEGDQDVVILIKNKMPILKGACRQDKH